MGNKELIDITEFARLDLRIGRIANAERIERSKKLIRLEVDKL
jgi:tRNA-binding EMAP/Myf-like protein